MPKSYGMRSGTRLTGRSPSPPGFACHALPNKLRSARTCEARTSERLLSDNRCTVLEAMMIGLPIVGLATTELVTVIENGVQGYIDTDVYKLIEPMTSYLPLPARRSFDP